MPEKITGKLFADKYRVDSLLRSSELGNFYRCRHAFTERPVILQVLRPELTNDAAAAERFSERAKAISKISHPNILSVTDFGKSPDGHLYATLENTEGETLREALERDGRVPAAVALSVTSSAALGLAAAHDAGMVHGSLNTGCVLIIYGPGDSKTVKVFDIGSAGSAAHDITDADQIVRDQAYIAPELCSGTQQPDARSDVYSLGVVFYEMLAGEPPFIGASTAEVIDKHNEEAPPPPLASFRYDLPPGIEPLVLKALAKDPEMRYQSASEFAEAIELYSIEPTSAVSAASDAGSNNIWKTAFVVLAGISLLSAFLIYGTSVKQTNPTTVLQPDANGQPVQPINPATGSEEQNLALMPGMSYDANSNSAMGQPPGTLPGGDNYNPWAAGTSPPPGAPPQTYVAPGGQVYQIDPNNPSQFMPMDGGVVLVPIPANTNTAKPTPAPKTAAANANTQAAPPAANTAPKSSPTPPAPKAAASPAKTPTKPAVNAIPKPD